MKKQIVKRVAMEEIGRQEWPLDKFLDLVQIAMKTIPVEHLHTAKVNLTADYDDPELTITYQREETDEEFKSREEKYERMPKEQREYQEGVAKNIRQTCAKW